MPPAERSGEEGAGGQLTDKRMQWLEHRITACLRLKPTEVKKFIENEDVRVRVCVFVSATVCACGPDQSKSIPDLSKK